MRVRWEEALEVHAAAAAELAAAARAVPAAAWERPVGEGKWTPAQIVAHLNLTYEVLLRELGGGAGMAVRTAAWQRALLRLLLVPRLLRGGSFPRGARAPRELREPEGAPQDGAVAAFRALSDRFAASAAEVRERRPDARLSHAYFGTAPVADGVLLCARHIQHHRRQLAAATA